MYFGQVNGLCAEAPAGFSITDDIETAEFLQTNLHRGATHEYVTSPRGDQFAIVTERGNVKNNALEAQIWLFSAASVRKFVASPTAAGPGVLLATLTGEESPIVTQVRWREDGRGLLFIASKSANE